MTFQIKKHHQRYTAYQDTGIPWLGEVPEGWQIIKLKYFSEITAGQSPSSDSVTEEESNGVPFLQGKAEFGRVSPCADKYCSSPKKLARKDSILISVRAPVGDLNRADKLYCIGRGLAAINSKKQSLLVHCLTACNQHLRSLSKGSTFEAITGSQLGSVSFPIPADKSEQTAIANYLDEKTELIDQTITAKKRQIELFKEKRSCLINRAVTRGIEDGVDVKDSGVEWIGKVPNHWEVKPLFSVADEQCKKNLGNLEQNVLSLSYGRIIQRDIETNFGLIPASFETYQIIKDGNIILRLTDLQNDKKSLRVGLVTQTGIITSAYVCLKVKPKILPRFMYALLHSYDLEKVFYSLGAGVRQTMKFSDLKRLPIPLPEIEEQREIVDYLDTETAKIDQTIALVEKSISLLEEYKTSLISNVVTGKIKVN